MLRGKKIKGEESNLEKKSHQDNPIDRITTNICAFQLNIEKNSLSREHFFTSIYFITSNLSAVCIILIDHLLIYHHDHSIKLQI